MNLYKIQQELIADRSAAAWYKVQTEGTSFHYRWQWSSGGESSYVIGEHHSYAVCREEPSLTMAWGMDVHSNDERRRLHFDWATAFPNQAVRAEWVDFFWNGALIDRVTLYVVDGGHGIIPAPSSREVTDFELAVAFLVHELDGSADSDPRHYLNQIGAKVVYDEAREGAGCGVDR